MSIANHYIGKQLKLLRRLLGKPPGKAMLHDSRVIIKKLRALWAIHPTAHTIQFKKAFPALHKLFKQAAKTRDVQITRGCIETLPATPAYPPVSALLEKTIRKHKKRLRHYLKQKTTRHALQQDMHHFAAYYSIASGIWLRQNRIKYWQEMQAALVNAKASGNESLHALRKKVKFALYQQDALCQHPPKKHKVPYTGDALLELQNDMGTWHDWVGTIAGLQAQAQKTTDKALHTLLVQARRKEDLLKRAMLCRIARIAGRQVANTSMNYTR